MAMELYNTLTRRKEPFEPLDPKCVRMYVCGPTVYNLAHIGNFRPAVVFDSLYRVLKRRYPKVVYVRNITDVDDKIMKKAREEEVPIEEITSRYTAAYHEDSQALNILRPDVEPRATEHIEDMIRMIATLLELGHAYEAAGHVLFDVASYRDYGALSRRTQEELLAGARVEVAPYKKGPGDFVLWKPSSDDQPGWESPWGRGRPGWHLECSAMAEAHLGPTIDIHGGGIDLAFPHHENEIAQSTCAHRGKTFSRFWLHNGFVSVDQTKMSKSLGNVQLLRELREVMPPEAIRYALLKAHYRQPLDWNEETVSEAIHSMDRLYQALRELQDVAMTSNEAAPALVSALEDDLNTPRALSELFQVAKEANTAVGAAQRGRLKGVLQASADLLGLLQLTPEEWFMAQGGGASDVDPARVEELIQARREARRRRDFAEADRIRDEIASMGVILEDKPDGGTQWRLQR
ncbi:MAG: cysteine--tRNA ligase [Myxococcota bacterium]